MGKNYQHRKNYYFCLSFHSKNRTWWQTNFQKKYLLEQIFHLVEMSSRNSLDLHVATAAASCRDKLLMQNIISANIELISGY